MVTNRELLAAWMLANCYATGHGDTVEDLLAELDWQHKERFAKMERTLGPDAVLPEGCACTMIQSGRSYGTLAFWINGECPLHGGDKFRDD